VGKRIMLRLAQVALGRILEIDRKGLQQEQHKAYLSTRLRFLKLAQDGMEGIVDDPATVAQQIAQVQRELDQAVKDFIEVKSSLATLDGYIAQIEDVFGHPERHVALARSELRMNRMNVKVEPGRDEPHQALTLAELRVGEHLKAVIAFVRCPRSELPARRTCWPRPSASSSKEGRNEKLRAALLAGAIPVLLDCSEPGAAPARRFHVRIATVRRPAHPGHRRRHRPGPGHGRALPGARRRHRHLRPPQGRVRRDGGGLARALSARRIDTFGVDIRVAQAVEEMVESLWAGGGLTGLVNNAAGNFIAPTESLSPRGLRRDRQHRLPRHLLRDAGGGQALGGRGEGGAVDARAARSAA
jgi:hypothetical protein